MNKMQVLKDVGFGLFALFWVYVMVRLGDKLFEWGLF